MVIEHHKISAGPLAAAVGLRQSRRGFLRTILAGSLLAGTGALTSACGGESAPAGGSSASSSPENLTKVKVALGWVTDVGFAGFWLAVDRGYYREQGLDVEFLPGGPNTPLPPVRVASGAADFGVDASMRQSLETITQGNDHVALGAIHQVDPTGLLSLAKRPVTKPADLPGLRILSQQGTQPLIEGLYKVNGLQPDFEFIPTGFDPGPLVAGKGDAYNGYVTNQAITLETQFGLERGSGYEVATYSDLGCPAYANLITCKRSLVEEKRDLAVRFMRATAKGWQDNTEDPTAAVKLVMSTYGVDLGLDEKQQTRQNELSIPLTESELTKAKGMLRMDLGDIKTDIYPWMTLVGAKLPDIDKVFDQTILDDVYTNGPRL